MKKKLLNLAIILLSLIVITLRATSAYGNDGVEITFSAKNGIYSRDYIYADTYGGYPAYRIYEDGYDNYAPYGYGYNGQAYDYRPSNYFTNYNTYQYNPYYNNYNSGYKYYSRSDLRKFRTRQKIANFVDRSAYSRYDINYGASSGEAFCNTQDCVDTDPAQTNWRYKYTYDPRLDGEGGYENYYYEPTYDSEKSYYNWRF